MSSKSFTKITSSHWGAFEVKVEDGKLISTQPFQHDANPNDISNLIPKAVYHKTRVKNPFIRKGWLNGDTHRNRSIRGEDEFVEVSDSADGDKTVDTKDPLPQEEAKSEDGSE